MNRYHYIDVQGNICDALPLTALQQMGLPPEAQVLPEGGAEWTTLAAVLQAAPGGVPAAPAPAPAAPPPGATPAKSRAAKGCLGCLGMLVLLMVLAKLAGPSDSGTTTASPEPQSRELDRSLSSDLQDWLCAGPWTCVDATSKGGAGFPGLMKGATFEFTSSRLRISGGDAEATHDYTIKSVSKASDRAADLFATLRVGGGDESVLKLKSSGGMELAAFTWMDGAWTLKLVRAQR